MRIEVVNVSHIFHRGTPLEKKALENVNLVINEGECILVAGNTGSGKSTLLQIVAGLIEPTSGAVLYDGERKKGYEIRRSIGIAFQYPEDQFFAERVFDEVAFAVKNFYPDRDPVPLVKKAMEFVGLDFDSFKDRVPFFLSGGEKRRVAIASVIVHEPDILILDEPLVGLDREGKTDLLGIVEKWKTLGKTVILISHDIETVMNHVDRVVVLEKGKKVFDGTRIEFLEEYDPRFFTSKMLIMRKLVLKGEYPFSMSDDELLERVCNS
ncbi:MAG: Energy-coupling factor transporter ATP-binding protein EcfA2 [Thermotoga petrophila]|jgi:energy-coupling factor transport system ATP-binding protein|uniref:Energy-coupling factor transporter ATP-binding protein EcfA2 n=1 Tax=Thermotoga petrophila TaxID=93929 RepID=A0A101EPX5_9THEM|nr:MULTISPECIES: energy-coupling factor ABC transporter ATP-binding protein EcfA2 [unclassified Thermotoga]KAF2959398.1 ABC transporter ATP-binding protein [Thermotoga sp. 38H-to]KHC93306.1 ABC transporter ATP-binding protein [Thermotoga sp. Mc24]KUK22708.1 MAG: Energy-coupling factor transporter ATP-binding protein EcfA2 [Thermotoga petrophila]